MIHLGRLLCAVALGSLLIGCGTVGAMGGERGESGVVDPSTQLAFGPASGLTYGAGSVLHPTSQVVASASIPEDGARRVDILWRRWKPSAFEKHDLLGTRQRSIAVPFQPTALEFVATDSLAVAGLHGEDLVVELWTLTDPFDSVESYSRVAESSSVNAGALHAVRREVFREPLTEERGVVTQLLWNRATRNGVFCLFQSDRNLYELRWGAEPDVHSLTVVVAFEAYPALGGRRFNSVHGGDHLQAGYLYAFGVAGELNRHPCLVLRDSDRDGEIDERSVLSLAKLDAFGFSKPLAWRELDGLKSPPKAIRGGGN
jgi:hypothetical protein